MKRFLKFAVVALILLLLIGIIGIRWALHSSLPTVEGTERLDGLSAEVVVERDELGVPSVRAATSLDAYRALGYLHGQERFFQMDLLRRRSAGELAALVGSAAVSTDKQTRLHRFRWRAQQILSAADARSRGELEAYAAGVNAGRNAIGRPPEYLVLRQQPQAWLPEDSLLAIFTMYLQLQDATASYDEVRGVIRDALPAVAVEFLLPAGSHWDAPLDGPAYSTPPIPSAEAWSPFVGEVEKVASVSPPLEMLEDFRSLVGSNNWAVSGAHTPDGRAIIADDMHLGLGMPNIWYRASLQWGETLVSGVTLPGVPGIVAGSSRHIAWGFTNTQGDWSDLVDVRFLDESRENYQTVNGPRKIERINETIEVAKADDETIEVRETVWGPMLDDNRAVRWVAHDRRAISLTLTDLAEATSLDEAIDIAHRTGLPAQNFVVASHDGRIGWTIAGPIPRRFGFLGLFPTSWDDGSRGWDGWLTPDQIPTRKDPESGKIWTANNRTMHGVERDILGDGGYVLGARAQQIRDALLAMDQVTELDLFELQLDDRAIFVSTWRDRLLALYDRRPDALSDERRAELHRQLVESWDGHASVDSVAYRMARGWRSFVATRVFDPLVEPCKELDDNFRYTRWARFEGPLESLLDEQPSHLLSDEYENWDALLWAAVDDLLDYFLKDGVTKLDSFSWGNLNQVAITHPLSGAMPETIRKRIDLPTESIRGDRWMPRVQGVGFGASERFAVSPGHEEDGIFHMPGGQSGHFSSPFYKAGHRAWADGVAAPFLPGVTKHTLRLVPTE